ncbi:MAG: DUF1127 domain-containing protein [Minwuia sp.]|nr:DUF1127 domain-containing protein [Minwuia sp.]
MTVHSYDLSHVDNGLFARTIAWVQDRFTDFRLAQTRARQLRELDDLSDRTLHDIGLSRSELVSVVRNPGDATRIR